MYIPRDAPHPDEWEYFKISNHITFHWQPQENMDRIYEPIMIVRTFRRMYYGLLDLITGSCLADGGVLPPGT